MTDRMNKEKWNAVFSALSRGIDEMTSDLEALDPNDPTTYGALEYEIEQAMKAFKILANRIYKA